MSKCFSQRCVFVSERFTNVSSEQRIAPFIAADFKSDASEAKPQTLDCSDLTLGLLETQQTIQKRHSVTVPWKGAASAKPYKRDALHNRIKAGMQSVKPHHTVYDRSAQAFVF